MQSKSTEPAELPVTAIAALHQGDKIEAIKAAREELSIGLKNAKDLVEAYLAQHPALQEKLRATSTTSSSALRWLAIVAATLFAVYVITLR